MSPKAFFAILGLLAAVYALGAGVGVARELGSGREEPAAVPAWAGAFDDVLKQGLGAGDVSAAMPSDCWMQLQEGVFTIVQEDACLLVIGASSAPVRTLTLRLAQGNAVLVRLDSNEDNRLTEEIILEGDRLEAEVQVFGKGGTLEIRCQAAPGSECVIETR